MRLYIAVVLLSFIVGFNHAHYTTGVHPLRDSPDGSDMIHTHPARFFITGPKISMSGTTGRESGVDLCGALEETYSASIALPKTDTFMGCGDPLEPLRASSWPAGVDTVPVTPFLDRAKALLAVHVSTDGLDAGLIDLVEGAVRAGFGSSDVPTYVGQAADGGASFGVAGLRKSCSLLDSQSTIVQSPRLSSCARGKAVTASWTQGAMIGTQQVVEDEVRGPIGNMYTYEKNLPGMVPRTVCPEDSFKSHRWCLRNRTLDVEGKKVVLSARTSREASLALWELSVVESIARGDHEAREDSDVPTVVHIALHGPSMLTRAFGAGAPVVRAYVMELSAALQKVCHALSKAHGEHLIGTVASYSTKRDAREAPRRLEENLSSTANVTSPTSEEINDWQITLWTGILLMLVSLWAIYFVASTDVVRDPMLYSQFKAADRRD